ncbi:unnamed protein product [Durusdinium trenchii]
MWLLLRGSALAKRGAKILRWECDTLLAREMAEYSEAPDFLNFCVENAGRFAKRDWLASLTLLTLRKRFHTSLPQFQTYNNLILGRVEKDFPESIHLLLHRYGVMCYAPAVWRLLPVMTARVPCMTPKQIALCAWSLGRTLVHEDQAWTALGGAVSAQTGQFALSDLAMFSWGLAAVDRAAPAEILAVKQAARQKLMGQHLQDVSSHNLCMLLKAISKLTPGDKRFLEWLLLVILEGMEGKTLAFAAQGITSIWSSLALLKWCPEGQPLEVLCEESRQLRLDHTFNQDMAAELARALLILDVKDPRPEYQIADYVARRGLSLRSDTLLTLAEFFALRRVDHDFAWKRLGVRAQQRGVDLSLPEIDRLVAAFRRAGRGNQRIFGMMSLFLRLREDQAKYGAA